MTLEQVQALRVGDMVRYHDKITNMETLEVVMSEWGRKKNMYMPNVCLQTVAVMNAGDDDGDKANIGDEGWINEYNHGCFEKIA